MKPNQPAFAEFMTIPRPEDMTGESAKKCSIDVRSIFYVSTGKVGEGEMSSLDSNLPKVARIKPRVLDCTMIYLWPGPTIAIDEPYSEVMRKIKEACNAG